MRIAVTGASGLLGTAVTAAAIDGGHSVVALDRPGALGSLAVDAVRRVDVDLTDYLTVKDAVQGCDAVIHLAALVSPLMAPEPVVHHNNVMASYNALLAAAENGIRKVCLASSVNAIGGAYSEHPRYDWFPVTEGHPSYSQDPYSLSKWVGEMQAADFARRDPSATIASLRFHALLRDEAHLAEWKNDLPRTAPKDLWGYTALGDAASACLAAVQADFVGSEVIYVVAPTTTALQPTAELLCEHYPDVPVRTELGGRSGFGGFFDCAKAQRLLGLTARTLDHAERAH
ncbi:MAG: NAD(P)-dependent oxidoreductase [Humibacillus sp.]|nr:NAD(P)-dependent oxidoreductase [Humibacillus sp.]MDN5779209.1 NAD(P)-dependent oxidoreductase [Humibacillus sp.]